MHRVHAGYTLLARLRDGRAAEAEAAIAALSGRLEMLFEQAATVHFASITVLPEQPYGDDVLPATLMLATSFCGPVETHVAELVRLMGTELVQLFAYCEDFDPGKLEQFIREHRHADAFYSGMQHLRPEDVENDNAMRTVIEDYLDRQPTLPRTALELRRQIQSEVRTKCPWTLHPYTPPFRAWLIIHWRVLLLAAIVLPLLLVLAVCTLDAIFGHSAAMATVARDGWIGVGALFVGVLALLLPVREAEAAQTYVAERQPDKDVLALAATQNRPVINEMTVVGPVKEGRLRPLVLRIALWVVSRAVEGLFIKPPLTIPTVATARWIAADGGRRLIFISNYTNAAEGYVRDFIDTEGGAKNINLSFGFGRGYPKTRWIVNDGALTDPNGFGYVVTANQRATKFWYGRYPNLSIDNITVNQQIREGLYRKMTEHEAKTWLHLL